MSEIESGSIPKQEEKEKRGSTVEVVRYMEQLGRHFAEVAQTTRAMIEEAEARGIPVDLSQNEALRRFQPTGEYEVQLLTLTSELQSVGTDLFRQGVKMTKEDVDARLGKMNETR